jgi:hypothetical protein
MNFWDTFATLLILTLEVAALAWLVVAVARGLYRRARRAAYRRARERQHTATVVRLAWMLVNERPSKVVYFTKEQVDATPDAAYLKMELTPNGYALKSAEAPDPSVHEQMTVG